MTPRGTTMFFKYGFPTRTAGVLSAVALISVASACSSSKSTPTATPSSSAPPAATSSTAPSSSSPSSSSPSSSASASTSTTVNVGSATVKGTQQPVLTAPDGHTLYYFTPDNASGGPTCTGGCAAMWPPLVSSSPSEASGATGKLAIANGGNGSQVTYNGHPLYEFASDSAAGQANGEGLLGKWFVATPDLATATNASTGGSTGGYSGGSGGY